MARGSEKYVTARLKNALSTSESLSLEAPLQQPAYNIEAKKEAAQHSPQFV